MTMTPTTTPMPTTRTDSMIPMCLPCYAGDTEDNLWQRHLELKLFTRNPQGLTELQNPCPTQGCYILDLNPSAVSEETASTVSPFKVAIVLEKKELQKPRPALGYYILYFGLKPINCFRRVSFGCKSIPSCFCPGEGVFEVIHINIWTVILRRVGPISLALSISIRQVPTLVSNCQTVLNFVVQSEKLLPPSCISGHWSSSSISPTRLWLHQRLQAERAAII